MKFYNKDQPINAVDKETSKQNNFHCILSFKNVFNKFFKTSKYFLINLPT